MSTNSIENKKKENSFWFNEPILLFKGNNTGDMFLISKKKSRTWGISNWRRSQIYFC